jgi:phosphoribulokinase
MSIQHPVVAVTGSSGAGTSTVKTAFEHIFRRLKCTASIIEGDSFHRYNRDEMRAAIAEAASNGQNISHFGPEANLLCDLAHLFKEYGETGTGKRRYYVHNEDEAACHRSPAGTFTDWEYLPADTDILLYEGLHGAMVTDECNVAQFADLLIGVVPIVNLEWIRRFTGTPGTVVMMKPT